MMIMIDMTDWLIEYTVYFGTLHVSAIILPNFQQKYMNMIIIYMLCTWKSCMQECWKQSMKHVQKCI